MTFETEVEIEAPAAEAFAAMADVRNETHWNTQVSKASLLSGEPITLGSQFETVNRGAVYAATLSRFDAPSALGFDVRGSGMDLQATFRFTPLGGTRCRLNGSFTMAPKGLMRLLLPLMAPMIRRDFPKQAARFARFCETRRPR